MFYYLAGNHLRMQRRARQILLLYFLLASICGHTQNIDINILKPINKIQTDFKDRYLEGCASSVTAISIGAPVTLFAVGLIRQNKNLQKDALFIGGSYITAAIITQSVKRIVDRQRPFQQYAFIVKRDDESGGWSFPSGHASAAFCTATSLSLRYPKWYVITPSFIWASSVAWARMYQGVHYPGDVLAGAVVGAGSAWLGYKVKQWMERKCNKHLLEIN